MKTDEREAALLGLVFIFVALAAAALYLAPAARAGAWRALGERWAHFSVLPVWAICAVLAHRFAGRHAPARDPLLLPLGFLLAGWGTLLVWRLLPEFGMRQTGWLAAGTVVLVAILRGPANLEWLRRYRNLWLAAGLFLTGLTLFFGTNPSGGEPRLWLGCCGLYFQPSEPLRLLLVAYLAAYISDRTGLQRDREQPMLLSLLGPLVVVWGLSTLLLFVQRDLGTGSLFLGLLAIMLYVATRRRLILGLAGGFILLAGALGAMTFTVVAQRIQAWLQPWANPLGVGYQIIQSLMAVASGGVFGQGFGLGAPGIVPATHTDFIFSAVAEEWGLLGGLALIAIVALLVGRGMRAASRARDDFHVLLATGLAAGIGLQSLLIIGGVIRVVPLTGVTLPFVSYGGSSLVTSFAALGFLLLASNSPSGGNRFRTGIQNVHLGLIAGWLVLAGAVGWWALVRAPAVLERGDNPRRAIETRFVRRGALLDRQGRPLATTVGQAGEFRRQYPEPDAASVVGFNSARFGQAGLEASLDSHLRGEEGHDPWREIRSEILTGSPPVGLDARLTVDIEMQRAAAQALADRRGAAIVLHAATGEIRALASSPSYDSAEIDSTWEQLMASDAAPLLNRATQSLYQPGLALAPLLYAWTWEVDPARPERELEAIGRTMTVDGEVLRCAGQVEPSLDASLGDALQLACPQPFADLAIALGPDELRAMVAAFHLGEAPEVRLETAPPPPVDISAESSRLDMEGVGQGGLNVSPLQLARAYAALVSGGDLPALRIVDALRVPGSEWRAVQPLVGRERALSASSAASTLEALEHTPEGHLEYVAAAVSGGREEGLSWYLGVPSGPKGRWLVVMVLEGTGLSQARQRGRGLQDALISAAP